MRYHLISLCADIKMILGVAGYTDYICQPWFSVYHRQPFMDTHLQIIRWQLSITDKLHTKEEISKGL